MNGKNLAADFNPLDFPLCFMRPLRIADERETVCAPFASAWMQMRRPQSFLSVGLGAGDLYLTVCQAVESLNLNAACFGVACAAKHNEANAAGGAAAATWRTAHDARYGRFSKLFDDLQTDGADPLGEGDLDLLLLRRLPTDDFAWNVWERFHPKLERRGTVWFFDLGADASPMNRLWAKLTPRFPHVELRLGAEVTLGVLNVGRELPLAVQVLTELSREQLERATAFYAALGERLVGAAPEPTREDSPIEQNALLEAYAAARQSKDAELRAAHERFAAYVANVNWWHGQFRNAAEQWRGTLGWKVMRMLRRFKSMFLDGEEEGRREYVKWIFRRLLKKPGHLRNRFDPLDLLCPFPAEPFIPPLPPQAEPAILRGKILAGIVRGSGLVWGPAVDRPTLPAETTAEFVAWPTAETLPADRAGPLFAERENTLDFCLMPHAAAWTYDPLGAVERALRLLKPGGLLYVSVPDRVNTADARRTVAASAHWLLDARETDRTTADRRHYAEWAADVLHHSANEAAFHDAKRLAAAGEPIRPHAFDVESFTEMMTEACRAVGGETVEVRTFEADGAYEHVAVLRRLPPDGELRRPVTIVVPVYNAYEQLVRTCESVLRRARGAWRMILVDDAGTDPRVGVYLRELARREPRVRILTNEKNYGFVITANRGMRAAEPTDDVLLLNSDVQVTEDFLRRLQDAAFATADTGVVTPFSNNASICSAPEADVPNELPPGCDAEAFNALIAVGSPRRRPEIVTAVGFCMYVRREVFSRIGWLDELSFGRGYGEENDFCARAVKAGFRIRLCDDLFVFHEGHASFGTEGEAKFHKHLMALECKQPGYILDTFRFVKNKTLHGSLWGVKAHLRRRPFAAEPALLVVLHADPYRVDAGGTEHHVLDRVAELRFPRVVLLYPQTAECVRAAEIFGGQTDDPLFYSFPLRTPLERFSLHHAEAEDLPLYAARIFDAAAVDFEHWLWWPLAAAERMREAGIPYVCTVHDFYGVCPKWNLWSPAKRTCGLSAEAPETCVACLEDLFRRLGRLPPLLTQDFLHSHLSTHRRLFSAMLTNACRVVFPSESARRLVETFYADTPLNAHVVPHGLRPPAIGVTRRPSSDRRLRVALIGNVAEEIKGRDLIVDIVRRTTDLPVEWHFFGNAEFGGLGTSADGKATTVFHGPYQRNDIVKLLVASGADVALFASLCPETFSFTLSEAWCAGIPAIAPRLGALGERVEQTGFGWLVEPYAAEPVVELLRRLTRNRAEVRSVQAKLADFQHPTLQENAARYREIFEPLLRRAEAARPYPPYLLTRHLEIPPPPPDEPSKK